MLSKKKKSSLVVVAAVMPVGEVDMVAVAVIVEGDGGAGNE